MSSAAVTRIITADPRELASWVGLADIAELMPTGWSLAGGSLVRLHLQERGAGGGRATRDIDLILDVRADRSSIRRMAAALRDAGFAPDGMNPSEQHRRWSRDDAQIDVLAPDFLGPRHLDRKHPGFGRLLPTRGAQPGLHRTERILVEAGGRQFFVNRPDLIGALYEKCSALLIVGDPDKSRHHEDIARPAALVTPDERHQLLRLRPKQRSRVADGLELASDSAADPNARRLRRLAKLVRPRTAASEEG